MAQKEKERNEYVDIIRGVAMLLVILGHTITGCTSGFEHSFIFNVIWSLQMPLFVLVSGYVTKYSRKIENFTGLRKFIGKRTLAYILPWIVWTFIIRGLIFGKYHLLNIGWLIYNMDSGYWFLTTIWTINIIFGLSSYFAEKFKKASHNGKQIITLIFYLLGMILLGCIGIKAGLAFFGIKLTLYYMPFYFAGYLYGQQEDAIKELKYGKVLKDAVVAVCFAIWIFILNRVQLYTLQDNPVHILIRAAASIAGCVAVCGLLSFLNARESGYAVTVLKKSGVYSLGIYLIHYLVLTPLKTETVYPLMSMSGMAVTVANYIITVMLSIIFVIIINNNKILKLILFGKTR